ncbi:hypothetical protein N9P58_01365 [Puniceicoccaceae bacterium]|nr:hypothetical protein [Puniceicoccaceae bacterium]
MGVYLFMRLILNLLAFASIALCANAQRDIRILYYDSPKGAPETAYLYESATAKGEEVGLPRWNFSETYEIRGGARVLNFLPQALPEGEEFPVNAPKVKIPKGWKKVLILAFPDPSNPVLPIRFQAINANDDKFGPGDLLFVNFSEISIFGLVGDKKLLVKPESTSIIKNPIKEKGDYHVKLDSVNDGIESRSWLLRQTWRHQPQVRRVIFAMPLPAPRHVRLYSAPIRNF